MGGATLFWWLRAETLKTSELQKVDAQWLTSRENGAICPLSSSLHANGGGKTANQGTKNPARVFHTTKISIASVPKPNETSWNHALHNLENGHADSKALKHLLEYALSFFIGFRDYAQIRRNATRLGLSLKQIKSRKAPKGTTKGKGHINTVGETTNLLALPLINHLVPKPIPQPDTSPSHPHYYKNVPLVCTFEPV